MDAVVVDFFLFADSFLETTPHISETLSHDAIKLFVVYVGRGAGGQGLDKFFGESR